MTTPVTILAPCFDEQEVISRFIAEVFRVMPADWELLVVDDGSTDRTPELLRELAAHHPRLRVVTHPENRGLGAALQTGFRESAGEVIVTMDADLSHPLDLLPALVAACATADAAFASRFVPGGAMQGVPFHRRAVSTIGNAVLRLLFRSPVRDLTTGFRACRAEVIRGLEITSSGFEAQLELSVRLVRSGARIVELPLRLGGRAAGASKMRYAKLVPAYLGVIARLAFRRRRR